MPYSVKKVRNKNCYSVKNRYTNKVHSKCTSREKAMRQLRLLHGVDSGWSPSRKSKSKSKSKRRSG